MLRFLAIAFLLAAILVPSAASAQGTAPASGCRRDCDPLEANDQTIRGAGDPVEVFLYARLDDVLNDGVLSTHPPLPEESIPGGIGRMVMPTVTTDTGLCVEGTQACADMRYGTNRVTLAFTPYPVRVEEGALRSPYADRLGRDLELGTEGPRLFWYMSAQNYASDEAKADVGVLAGLEVRARLVTGLFSDPVTIAESSPVETLARPVMFSVPGQRTVYEFEVPLTQKRPGHPIPKEGAFQLEIEWSQLRAGNLADATQSDWRVHVGPEFKPRLVMTVYEPNKVVNQTTQHFADKYYMRWSVFPAFGDNDVDEASLRLDTIRAPPGAQFAFDHLINKRGTGCFEEPKPIVAVWALDYRNATLPDGVYVVRASILNVQGTYLTTSDFEFKVVGGVPDGRVTFTGEASVPGVGFPTMGALVGLVGFVVSRRRAA